MSTAASYIVLKNLKDANVSDINTSHELKASKDVNVSVESSASTKLEIDFHDVLLLTFIVFCANIAFKLLEKWLDWILHLLKKEKKDTATRKDLL